MKRSHITGPVFKASHSRKDLKDRGIRRPKGPSYRSGVNEKSFTQDLKERNAGQTVFPDVRAGVTERPVTEEKRIKKLTLPSGSPKARIVVG